MKLNDSTTITDQIEFDSGTLEAAMDLAGYGAAFDAVATLAENFGIKIRGSAPPVTPPARALTASEWLKAAAALTANRSDVRS